MVEPQTKGVIERIIAKPCPGNPSRYTSWVLFDQTWVVRLLTHDEARSRFVKALQDGVGTEVPVVDLLHARRRVQRRPSSRCDQRRRVRDRGKHRLPRVLTLAMLLEHLVHPGCGHRLLQRRSGHHACRCVPLKSLNNRAPDSFANYLLINQFDETCFSTKPSRRCLLNSVRLNHPGNWAVSRYRQSTAAEGARRPWNVNKITFSLE